jgi:2,3-bisphosphoglycerate-independent phosphoglycerate mutase
VNAAPISDNDSVIFINFRPDRAREITRALVDPDFDGFERKVFPKDLTYVCMAEYDATMPNVTVAFPPEEVDPTLGKTIADLGLRQLRIAETEKYAHVTFFFNGGVEAPNKNEDRILIPSPKVATYDLQPEMSAPEVASTVIEKINEDIYDLIILNFANPDMVGHTGVFDAAVKAIETLDGLVGNIAEAILAKDGQILLTADHGNADYMIDDEGKPVTKHSTSKVPLCHICKEPVPFRKDTGKLADIAPTLLTLMGLEVPAGMEGDVLV